MFSQEDAIQTHLPILEVSMNTGILQLSVGGIQCAYSVVNVFLGSVATQLR